VSSGALIKTAHATKHLFNCRSGFIPRFEMPSRRKAAPTTIPIQAGAVRLCSRSTVRLCSRSTVRLRSRTPTSSGVSDPKQMNARRVVGRSRGGRVYRFDPHHCAGLCSMRIVLAPGHQKKWQLLLSMSFGTMIGFRIFPTSQLIAQSRTTRLHDLRKLQ
jgi:hypothetical protein